MYLIFSNALQPSRPADDAVERCSAGKNLDESRLTPGVYLIKAILDGEMQTFKIVKE